MPAPHHSSFLQAGCPSCHPTNSVKALKAITRIYGRCSNVRGVQDHVEVAVGDVSTILVV